MKRYNQVRDGSYEPRSEMVEEIDGDYVLWEDVDAKCAELESKCAELLEAAKNIVGCWDGSDWEWDEHIAILIDRLRAAIAKAEGGGS